MIVAIVVVALLVAVAITVVVLRYERRAGPPAADGGRRILFPIAGMSLSAPALDSALRLARAEGATLVPLYLLVVPLNLPLEAEMTRECERALPLLEAIEQRATHAHVAVDSRIVRGRTYRHALEQAMQTERFGRVVATAGEAGDGFSPEDVEWLLENAPGEILVLRPSGDPLHAS